MFTVVCVLQSAANITRAGTFPSRSSSVQKGMQPRRAQDSHRPTRGDIGMGEHLSNLDVENQWFFTPEVCP